MVFYISNDCPFLVQEPPAFQTTNLEPKHIPMSAHSSSSLEAAGSQFDEPLIEPATARKWLLATGRVIEGTAGTLEPHPDIDHLGEAGLAIALGAQATRLSEKYAEAKGGEPTASLSIIKGIAALVLQEYK